MNAKNEKTISAVLVLGAVLMGCSSTRPSTRPPAAEDQVARSRTFTTPRIQCPIQLPGTTIATEKTLHGVAIIYRLRGTELGELRTQTWALASIINLLEEHQTSLQDGGGDEDPSAWAPEERIDPIIASVGDIENGVQLQIRPREPVSRPQSRARVRAMGEQVKRGHCLLEGVMSYYRDEELRTRGSRPDGDGKPGEQMPGSSEGLAPDAHGGSQGSSPLAL